LALRGPGDFLGNRQHGIPEMRIADLFADKQVLLKAKDEAQKLLSADPQIKLPENANLRQEIIEIYRKLK
jgi:ATP-dependent DNA helicase RecG